MDNPDVLQKKNPPTAMKKHPQFPPSKSGNTKATISEEISSSVGNGTKISDSHNLETKRKKKILSWDEQAIEEHDLLRGTRMKIDEADTPFNYYDEEEDQISVRSHSPASLSHNGDTECSKSNENSKVSKKKGKLCLETLEMKLEAVAASRNNDEELQSVSSHGSNHQNLNIHHHQNQKEENFKKARANHYNEMEMLRKFRAEHMDDDEDDDDEDDDE